MNIKELTENISVSAQIKHSDIADLAKLGFKTVINNRPDREVPFQPRTKTLAARAKKVGITYLYLPVKRRRRALYWPFVAQAHAPLISGRGPILRVYPPAR